MRIVVLIPRRADGGRRDRIWNWVRDRWAQETDWPVYEGHHEAGKFNRSAAINAAASDAGEWDVGVIADADTFCGTDQLMTAVDGIAGCGFWLAYDRFCYLNRQMSDRVMAGFDGAWEPGIEFELVGTCSSMVVVRRDVWDRAGGFDEGFVGWGFEDVGASHAFQTYGGGLRRSEGPAWHLWHPPSTENDHRSPEWNANRARAERYHESAYDEDAMEALLAELGVK